MHLDKSIYQHYRGHVLYLYHMYCLNFWLNSSGLLYPAEFHFLCPNGQGLYYEEGLQYSLPAYHGKSYVTSDHTNTYQC